VKTIREKILKDDILSQDYYTPFIIFLYPYKLDLKDFDKSKTFQYRTTLQLILKKKGCKLGIDGEIINEFYKRLNIIFSYYNELGDEFSFINSERKEMPYKNIDDSKILDYINIVLLGGTGAGKSTLINILLDEKKSIEGGTGLPTTSKNVIIYKKENIPLRFYDVKGIENDKTLQNQIEILDNLLEKPNNAINVILYLIENKSSIVNDNDKKLFEKLVNYKIPILFVITKTPFNPYNPEIYKEKKRIFDKIQNAIESKIKEIFRKENKENESKIFIKENTRLYYINIEPLFGFDKLLSFFTEAVPKEDWDKLEESCRKNDSENCKKLWQRNFYLKSYGDFDDIKDRNKKEALDYLTTLKVGAVLTGWIPIGDIAFESFYRKKFIEKLITLYGIKLDNSEFDTKEEEKKCSINQKDLREISNEFRNAISVIRGIGEFGLGAGKIAACIPLKVVSWAMLPVTIIGCSAISCININKDCLKILDIFDKAFEPRRFEILLSYIKYFRDAVDHLKKLAKK
jgi:GTPase Era involved in 16S rRNA processing